MTFRELECKPLSISSELGWRLVDNRIVGDLLPKAQLENKNYARKLKLCMEVQNYTILKNKHVRSTTISSTDQFI